MSAQCPKIPAGTSLIIHIDYTYSTLQAYFLEFLSSCIMYLYESAIQSVLSAFQHTLHIVHISHIVLAIKFIPDNGILSVNI